MPFVFRHWLKQPVGATVVAGGMLGVTIADLFMPVFSGHLVDAMTSDVSDPADLRAVITAFGAIVALGRASPGDVTYVLTTYYVIHAYLRDVGMHINNLQLSVNDMEELVAIHDMAIGIADAPDAKAIDIQGERIVLEDVTFIYGGHRVPLYEDLSVDIRAGERVGLVGCPGSGKTTFVKLVQRLYDVSGGRIVIDGLDIAKATQQSLRSQIAIVQQDPILFHRSLAENIAYGWPGASMTASGSASHCTRVSRRCPGSNP